MRWSRNTPFPPAPGIMFNVAVEAEKMWSKFLAILVLAVAGLALLTACKSNEKKMMEWYEEQRAAIEHELPPTYKCDLRIPQYRAYYNNVGRSVEVNTQQIEEVLFLYHRRIIDESTRDRMIRANNDATMQRNEGLRIEFERGTRWTPVESAYCNSRLYGVVVDSPDRCSHFADIVRKNMDSILVTWPPITIIETIDFCLEQSPRFLNYQ